MKVILTALYRPFKAETRHFLKKVRSAVNRSVLYYASLAVTKLSAQRNGILTQTAYAEQAFRISANREDSRL